MQHTEKDIDFLLSPVAIRERANRIFELACAGKTNYKVNLDKLPEVADFVVEVIKDNYPDLKIPFHSRWGHFQVGDEDRVGRLEKNLEGVDPIEKVRVKLDLAITSVLLDAGAGPTWKYDEKSSGKQFNRSEGLGVASYYMFLAGHFSSREDNPYRADAGKLSLLSEDAVVDAFQVNDSNPLVGVKGRVQLLRSLGDVVSKKKEFFPEGRPGSIVDYLINKHGNSFEAKDVLDAVLRGLGDIWPGRLSLGGVNLGDVWKHNEIGEEGSVDSLIPFHKLSQWLTYSLLEPMMDAGIEIKGVEKLTGLAEYRNGGLLLDKGLIELRDAELLGHAHKPDGKVIIEWRALTIIFLDKLADLVREKLNLSEQDFPLAKVLEGGTWWAGRRAAKALREDSSPPLKLDSDGTVF